MCSSLLGGLRKLNRNFYIKIETCNVLLNKTYSTRELLKEAYCRTKLKCRCKYDLTFFFENMQTNEIYINKSVYK